MLFVVAGKPVRFEIMDTSNNVPDFLVYHKKNKPVTHEFQDNGVINLIRESDNEILAEIHVTGYMTDITDSDIIYKTF